MTLAENALRNGHRFTQQRLGFFEPTNIDERPRVVVGFNVAFSEVGTLSPQEAADFDLCEMIRAPVFVRGKAGFAALAEGLRDFAHKETVSDLAGLDGAFVGQRERDNWATIGD